MKIVAVLFLLLLSVGANAQPACPHNIGFEVGNLDAWEPNVGTIAPDGTISVSQGIKNQRIFRNTGTPELDFYGNFPVTAPNGSQFSVKIGHNQPGGNVEQLAYSLRVPSNTEGFSIIFNYAIVLQNPNHLEHEQPRFTVKVFNENRGTYIECSSFDFVAGYNNPDFLVSEVDRTVLYKTWSSASINLNPFKGERLRLEFSVNDCSRGGHFGYAYFDIAEKCGNSITGNIICPGTDNVTLQAPSGFAGYQWFTGDFSRPLNQNQSFTLNTPAVGDSFAVVLLPYSYLGCRDTFYTKINSVTEPIQLIVKETLSACADSGVDLTKPDITRGSSSPLQLEYFINAAGTAPVPNPKNITTSGTYLIQATNSAGCVQTKPVAVTIYPVPSFAASDPPILVYPATANLTTLPDNPQLSYTYWENGELTKQVLNPLSVNQSGVYFVKGTTPNNCFAVQTVEVKVSTVLFVPTAFTPNRDGKNDRFIYKAMGGLREIAFFKVYNRWGQEVFSTTQLETGWDGTIKGLPAEAGTYVWVLKAKDWLNKEHFAKGTVLLIR